MLPLKPSDETETNQRTKKSPRTVVNKSETCEAMVWGQILAMSGPRPPPPARDFSFVLRLGNPRKGFSTSQAINKIQLCCVQQLTQHVRMVSQPQCCHWRLVPGCPRCEKLELR